MDVRKIIIEQDREARSWKAGVTERRDERVTEDGGQE